MAIDFENEDEVIKELEHDLGHSSHTPHEEHEEGGGHGEPWLMSYADMMTLLFGFFVLMYSYAIADAGSKEKIKKEVAESMGGKYENSYQEMTKSLEVEIQKQNFQDSVGVETLKDGIRMTSKGTMFFESGSVVLREESLQFLNQVAEVLKTEAKGFQVTVEGHTDDVPVSMPMIPSNWELSSLRAGTVIRFLEGQGLERGKLRALGMADTKPIVPNRDEAGVGIPENQAKNRRIVINVTSTKE